MLFGKHLRATVRRATKVDYQAITQLIDYNWAVHVRLIPEDIKAKLNNSVAYIVEDQVAMRGFFMVEVNSPQSMIVVVAIHDNREVAAILDAILPQAEVQLQQCGVKHLLHIGEEAWLTDRLIRYGFELKDEIITFMWPKQPLPSYKPHPDLQIRSVRRGDLTDLLVLDELAFGDLWHKPRRTIYEAMAQAASFKVALLNGILVGYYWCDQFGHHGHLTRIATHPAYQRQGIATQLLYQAIQSLVDLNVTEVSLNTQKDNYPSQQLYERFGFKATFHTLGVYQKKINIDLNVNWS